MSQTLEESLQSRKNRAIATILSVKDENCDPFLPEEASSELRLVVLEQLNDFCEFAIAATRGVGSSDMNDEYLHRKVDAILALFEADA